MSPRDAGVGGRATVDADLAEAGSVLAVAARSCGALVSGLGGCCVGNDGRVRLATFREDELGSAQAGTSAGVRALETAG